MLIVANEFVHGSVGVGMTQAEFEAVGLHVINSQATGDLIYASSATQLSRLGIGATNAILTVIGGVPTWQTTLSGLTFVAPALGAATATSINGLVVTTTAGTLTIANNASAALVTSGNYSITLTATAATNVTLPTTGTLATLAGTEELDSKTLDSSVGKGTWTASGTWTIPAVTLGGTVTGGNNNLNNIGHIGIGNAASVATIGIYHEEIFTDTTNANRLGGYFINSIKKTSAAFTGFTGGVFGRGSVDAGNTQNWTGALGMRGVISELLIQAGASGTITGGVNFYAIADLGATTLTNRHGVYIENAAGAGTLTNQYGVYVESLTKGATLNYALYCVGANVGIFAALPTSDPTVAGKWWSNAGVVTISAG